MPFTVSKILTLIAVICFVLAAFGVALPIALIPIGLAFFASSFITS